METVHVILVASGPSGGGGVYFGYCEGPRAPRVTLALSSWAVHESGGKDLGAPQVGDYW